eukprot:CAMPEP_0181121890 /NCGR_PEP_ID=MMETSP1071-20121207/24998_1 /TAXON_ID=35127 /ORGANISM="Thalassiosira sp., Strain NH16" /LENGTH=676 /DNA_ID=CAMNT_0023206777 /DNA_START=103 /DNA_END=2131 /DNA_ORIENTATION=-
MSHPHDNGENDQQKNDPQDEEHASLINEIRRLENSMNGALRASRDEMEILKGASIDKKLVLEQMEEELENIMKKLGNNQPRRLSQSTRCPSSASSGSRSRRRSAVAAKGGGATSDMRKSLMRQNSLLRRVSVPVFRRPSLKDADAEMRESFRRRSDPIQPPDTTDFYHMSNRSLACDDASSWQSSKGSKESFNGNDDSRSEISDSQDATYINNTSEEETDQEIIKHQEMLESKNQRIAQLQKEKSSNSNQLLYLQSKLQSIQTQSRSRWVQHTSTVDELNSKKQTLSKSIDRRGRLIKEVEGCYDGYEKRIATLEKEIEAKMGGEMRNGQFRMHGQHGIVTGNNNSNISQLQEEIRRCKLWLQIHSQYTAKVLQSFLSTMDTAKNNDNYEILFKKKEEQDIITIDDNEEYQDNNKEERRHLIDGIAFDVDIHLNNLERMIKEVDARAKEYMLLSSIEADPATRNISDDKRAGNDEDSSHRHPSQLLLLTEECADLLSDFISTISNTMESTVRAVPHSFSIEFQPSSSSPSDGSEAKMYNIITTANDIEKDDIQQNRKYGTASSPASTTIHVSHHNNTIDNADLPYFQIQRKRLHLHELQRSQLHLNTNISLLQNDIQSFQTSIREEKRVHCEMMCNLQAKLGMLTERLEDGGDEILALVNELEQWKQREDSLLQEL